MNTSKGAFSGIKAVAVGFALCFYLLFVIPAAGTTNNSVDILAVEYPPFTSNEMPTNGIGFELLRQRLANTSIDWSPFIVPPARAQGMIASGNWCVSFYPPKQGVMGNDYYPLGDNVDIALIRVQQDDPFRLNRETLTGKTVAVLRPSKEGQIHERLSDYDLQLIFVETVEQGFRMMIRERVDFVLADTTSAGLFEASHDSIQLQPADTPLMTMQVGVYLNHQCGAYALLDKALKAQRDNHQ
ncbi:hypothetical protein [Lacimicrobium sp. SS2-24]|uniref:hypothetical protein n=1 Tax=Lacimicrobium sp. SS2-24 TaxID=2005569 RepID=UPI000B4AA6BF|nr:hypothetical protein [Lacimicrobium sp. SS2-24]